MSNQKDIGDKGNIIFAEGECREGYLCPDCQMVECRRCDKKALEYEIIEGEFVCMDCLTIQEVV